MTTLQQTGPSRVRRGVVAVVAALSAALLTSACGDSGSVGGAKDAGQASVAAGETVTLNYWTWFPGETTLNKSIAAFEAANPNIKISLREFAGDDYVKQLPLALNGGQDLDIVGVMVAPLTNAVRSQLRPVSDWSSNLSADWENKIAPTVLQQTQSIAKDNKLYSIPMGSIGAVVMYANTDVLKKHGLNFPKTLDDLKAAVAKIKTANDGVAPVAFSGDLPYQEDFFLTVADQVDPMLSDKLYTNKVAWNSPQMLMALTAYQNLFSSAVIDTATLSLKGSAAGNQFNSGKAAFLIEGSWNSSVLSARYRQANGISVGDVTAGAVPVVVAGGQPTVRTYAEGGLGIPKSSKYAAQAAKFIEFMTVGDGLSTWAPDLALVPSKTGYQVDPSVLSSPAAQQGFAAIQQLMSQPGSGRGSYVTPFTTEVLDNGLLDLARGNTTPQALADKLQQEWTSGRYPLQ